MQKTRYKVTRHLVICALSLRSFVGSGVQNLLRQPDAILASYRGDVFNLDDSWAFSFGNLLSVSCPA
jgi:hypothetical protein